MEKIYLFDALKQMRDISNVDGEFSFSFIKYNRQKNKGGDKVIIKRARLRARPMDGKIENSLHKLFFTDLEQDKPENCWQILIVEFNGKKTYL